MNTWYWISAPAFVLIIITATARLADLGRQDWALIDHLHRIGLIGIAAAYNCMLYTPWATDRGAYLELGWRICLLSWSLAVVWITKRGMIPWWDFILGVHRQTDSWKALGRWGRIHGEFQALRDSFKPQRFRQPLAGPKGPLP